MALETVTINVDLPEYLIVDDIRTVTMNIPILVLKNNICVLDYAEGDDGVVKIPLSRDGEPKKEKDKAGAKSAAKAKVKPVKADIPLPPPTLVLLQYVFERCGFILQCLAWLYVFTRFD